MSIDTFLPAADTGQPDSQFLPGTSVQYAWDSVSLTSILACPRRYKYQIVDGLVSRSPNFAIALVFGILLHKGLEFYELAKADGADHDAALHTMVSRVLALPATATLPTDEDVEEMKEEAKAAADEDDGITLRNSKVRTRYYLIRALVWYVEHYKDDPLQTLCLPSGKPAVEVSFRLPIEMPEFNHPLLLCGHIDRVVDYNGSLYVTDYKSTKSISRQFFASYLLSHQLTGYTIAGSSLFEQPVRGAIVDGIALQVGGVKLGRAPSQRTPGQVGEYFQTLALAQRLAHSFAETGYYPMNTASCYFCEFKEICAQPPEYRDKYLNLHFERRRGWNPLENR
jgi:hypothetical protein